MTPFHGEDKGEPDAHDFQAYDDNPGPDFPTYQSEDAIGLKPEGVHGPESHNFPSADSSETPPTTVRSAGIDASRDPKGLESDGVENVNIVYAEDGGTYDPTTPFETSGTRRGESTTPATFSSNPIFAERPAANGAEVTTTEATTKAMPSFTETVTLRTDNEYSYGGGGELRKGN